jgi:hypothetical protein
LSDKLDKPTRDEDEFFAREELEKLRKIAFDKKQTLAETERVALQKLHHMKCPNCGLDLHAVKHGHVEVDTCFNCHGMWLQQGELEQILKDEQEGSRGVVMRTILNLFSREAGK